MISLAIIILGIGVALLIALRVRDGDYVNPLIEDAHKDRM